MKRIILITITALLIMGGVCWGAGLEGVALTGTGVNPPMPSYFWPLETNLVPTAGSDVYIGTETYAGTNRTRVNPDTGLIEDVAANVARFEEVGGHRALLIEPAGTNLCTHSHEFDNAAWVKMNSSISANTTVGPDGTTNADTITQGAANSASYVSAGNFTYTSGEIYTISAFMKYVDWQYALLDVNNNFFTGDSHLVVDLINGTITDGSDGTDQIVPLGNGWYRVSMSVTCTLSTNIGNCYIGFNTGSTWNATVVGDNSSQIHVCGAQVEESPVPTSYIATSGAAVTRATESGEPHFTLPTGLFDDQGTAIVWWRPGYGYAALPNTYTTKCIVSTQDNPTSLLENKHGSGNGWISSTDGVNGAFSRIFPYAANTWYKLIVKWGYLVGGVEKFRVGVDSGSGVVWGTEVDFDGSYTLGSYIRLGYGLFGPMHLRNLMLFPDVLTDAEINQRGGTP